MSKNMSYPLLLFIIAQNLFVGGTLSLNEDRKVYIVYMGSIAKESSITPENHLAILQHVIDRDRNANESLVRSYTRRFNGFASKLTKNESEKLKSLKEVVSVFPSTTLELHTTRSWDFMGFTEHVASRNQTAESDLIIGVIDSGITLESCSFSDDGFGPPPKKWKGVCKGGENFTCNNKIIGARTAFNSARDEDGHETHTASTAAGRIVDHTSFFGIAEGDVRGAVPNSRIAVYKACENSECSQVDILSAFDDAIADGVDFITISAGTSPAIDVYSDCIAIGHAMQKGVLTLQSVGNHGNNSSSTGSVAPWIFSVGASSMDRRILTKSILGSGKTLVGDSINAFTMKGKSLPLAYGLDALRNCSAEDARRCKIHCLDKDLVKGKIVVCDSYYVDGVTEVMRARAVGLLQRTYLHNVSLISPIPAIQFEDPEFEALLSYCNSTKNPKATILKSECFNDTYAPVVASFSSRGPNPIASDILKPDVVAPGVEILAAFSPDGSVSQFFSDKRKVKYSILSGTSMACPHVAGAAAYAKSIHPDWSASAIKSALMTTAHLMSPSKNPDAEFAYGSGHLNPVMAATPGLVYETTQDDYLIFLCKLGYNNEQIAMISGNKRFSCPKKGNRDISARDVNYPTMASLVTAEKSFNVQFSRTVTNVNVAISTYTAKVESTGSIKVTVTPDSLSFTSLKEKKSFNVTVVGEGLSKGSKVSASLVWSDGNHNVRSPIVIYTKDDPKK